MKKCPDCNEDLIYVEYPEIYDGAIELTCPTCHKRWGRFTKKLLSDGEHEDPRARFGGDGQ